MSRGASDPLWRKCCLINSLRSLRTLRAEKNIRMVIIYLTQRAQRTRRFNSHTVHAGAGVVVSFTTTGERRGLMTNEYTIQLLISAYLCALLSCVASDLSSDSVNSKIFATFASSACGKNIRMVAIYLTQRAQRARSFNFHTVHAGAEDIASFTATGERRGSDRSSDNIFRVLCDLCVKYNSPAPR